MFAVWILVTSKSYPENNIVKIAHYILVCLDYKVEQIIGLIVRVFLSSSNLKLNCIIKLSKYNPKYQYHSSLQSRTEISAGDISTTTVFDQCIMAIIQFFFTKGIC